MESESFKLQSADLLQERIEWARTKLASADTAELLTSLDLADQGTLGPQYERGTVHAYKFDAGSECEEEEFATRLHHLLNLPSVLYTDDEAADDEVPSTETGAVHLLLKWSPTDPETIEKHLAVAEAHDGYVHDVMGVLWEADVRVPYPVRFAEDRFDME
jgi:hypothetical protein